MEFNFKQTAFGRHETFALRYSWLSKGIRSVKSNPDIFKSDTATIELGVGKNMVSSIQYWLRACQLMNPNTTQMLPLGDFVFDEIDGADPYFEDEATIWLIHWLLASNPSLSTSWYWFFNKYHKPEFTAQELTTALNDWVKENVKANVSPSTLKSDAALIARMYNQVQVKPRSVIEDILDSPLSLLKLISQGSSAKVFQCKPMARPSLPDEIIGFAVTQLMQSKNITSIPLEELMYSRDDFVALGSVFRLTENDLITKLECLIRDNSGYFEIRETAGIHQLYLLKKITPIEWLQKYYEPENKEVAA